jgi:hypothetical protein
MTIPHATDREPRELFDRDGVPEFWSLTPTQYRLLLAEVQSWRTNPRAALRMHWRAEQARWGETSSRFKGAVRSAISRGHAWDLRPDEYEFLVAQPCAVCGESTGNALGLDRIDHGEGYRADNVRPCCGRCNLARGRRALDRT